MSDGGQGPQGPGQQGGAADDVGSLGEEAAKLFGVLAGWANEVNDHVATGAPECAYCPVCRTIHTVRECSPEVRDHLVSAAASLMQAAADVLTAAGDRHPQGGSDGDGSAGGRAGSGVHHIDLDGEWPDDPTAGPGDPTAGSDGPEGDRRDE